MKKLFKLLPLLLLSLTACNNGGNGGGGGNSGDDSGVTPDLPTGKEVVVLFYLDYNHADENNPYFKGLWYYGRPIDRNEFANDEGEHLVDPKDSEASYKEFGHFLGWSLHPVVDSEEDLWNFETDTKGLDARGKYLTLYGIWTE